MSGSDNSHRYLSEILVSSLNEAISAHARCLGTAYKVRALERQSDNPALRLAAWEAMTKLARNARLGLLMSPQAQGELARRLADALGEELQDEAVRATPSE